MQGRLKEIVQQRTAEFLHLLESQQESLKDMVHMDKSILISGLYGSGKTELLDFLMCEVKENRQNKYISDNLSRKGTVDSILFQPIDYTDRKGQIRKCRLHGSKKEQRGTLLYDELMGYVTPFLFDLKKEESVSNLICTVVATSAEDALYRVAKEVYMIKDWMTIDEAEDVVKENFDHQIHLTRNREGVVSLSIV